MAIESVQDAFVDFESRVVRIPPTDNDAAKTVHPEIRRVVEQELPVVAETFLSGSYARRVQVAPRLKDIDIIVVLTDETGKYERSAEVALDHIREAARVSELVRQTERNVRSVLLRLRDYDFTVDLVAALPRVGGPGLNLAFYKPEEGEDGWRSANPQGQLQAAIDKNKACDGMYIPAVRLIKYWNTSEGSLLKSYHAEAILWHALHEPVDFDIAVGRFFAAAHDALAPEHYTTDPGAPGVLIDELLEDEQRLAARERVDRAGKIADEALQMEDPAEALEEWARIFGPAFPCPSNSPEALAAALLAGDAAATGAGIRVGGARPVIRSRSWRP